MEVLHVAIVTKNVEVADKRLSIETGRVAEQANGAVILRQGDTVVLSTAVMAKEPREGIDWFPLTCDYEEKLYAAGKIPGAFMRREGRPSETAILASRLTDRPLRPLFPEGFRLDVQVISTVLSLDQVMYSADKHSRESAMDDLRVRTIVELGERFPEYADIVGKVFDKAVKDR